MPRFEPSTIRWLVLGANHCANIILHYVNYASIYRNMRALKRCKVIQN